MRDPMCAVVKTQEHRLKRTCKKDWPGKCSKGATPNMREVTGMKVTVERDNDYWAHNDIVSYRDGED